LSRISFGTAKYIDTKRIGKSILQFDLDGFDAENVDDFDGRNKTVNFINVLRTSFSYKSAFFAEILLPKPKCN